MQLRINQSDGIDKFLPFELCCKIYVLAQNPNLKHASTTFCEISKEPSVCADFILKKRGKKNFFIKNKKLISHEKNMFGNKQFIDFLILKGAEVGKAGKFMLLHSVKKHWHSTLNLLMQLFEIKKNKRYAIGEKPYDELYKIIVKPQILTSFSNQKLLLTALRENNTEAVKSILDAHKILPKLEMKSNQVFESHPKIYLKNISTSAIKVIFQKNNFELAELLTDYGLKYTEYPQLISEMSRNTNVQVINFLISKGLDPRYDCDAALLEAIYFDKNTDVVEYLLSIGLDANARKGKVLEFACRRGNLNIVKILLKSGAKFMPPHSEAFYNAINSRNLELVKYLTEQGVDIFTRESRSVSIACNILAGEIVQYLILKGAKVCIKGDLLISACSHWYERYGVAVEHTTNCKQELLSNTHNGKKQKIKKIVSLPKTITSSDMDKDLKITKLILDAGANVQMKNNEALIEAVRHVRLETVALLISKGADVCARNNQAIVDAVNYKCHKKYCSLVNNAQESEGNENQKSINSSSYIRYKLVRMLVEAGADVNAQNGEALIRAINQSNYRIVNLLVLNGANAQIRNNQALMDSIKQPDPRILELLLNKVANRQTNRR
ncbi:hypothetical protein BB561_004035 [Smittium simulii]|uniref:Uncharacterized protein n=1 Tax=Smittium simulii TaxID=133385 RepID=A0A2T9YIJ3_9FUNG|nr:hypothetical protein BB561_004035 [Smittium simulii]